MFFAGCEDPDDVRANPVSLEIDGTYFVTKPDGSFVWGPGGSSENPPDAAYRHASMKAISFSVLRMTCMMRRGMSAILMWIL